MTKQKTIPELETEKAENERKLSQLQHKKQQIENRITYYEKGDRRKRAHHLITCGAAIETVCQLVLRKPAVHINIDVDVEELVQDKRGAATYGQIKDYVLEHSGLKVSSLYIAQVKQKYGIIERENYNKTKSENVKQPQCPPEKEKAITEALKHFGMI